MAKSIDEKKQTEENPDEEKDQGEKNTENGRKMTGVKITSRPETRSMGTQTDPPPPATEATTDTEKSKGLKTGLIIGAAIGATALVAAAPLAIAAVGFGSSGVVAGSIAAAWQSAIGNVAAGSLFASLQSAGAVGLGIAGTTTAATAGAAAGAAVGAAAGVAVDAAAAGAAADRSRDPTGAKVGTSGSGVANHRACSSNSEGRKDKWTQT